MSKQFMAITVRLSPQDRQVAFFRLNGVGIRQFTQLPDPTILAARSETLPLAR